MSTTNISKLTNYAYVLPDEIDEWKDRGFEINEVFALDLWYEPGDYVVMTREPIKMIEYGMENIIGCEIIEISPCRGSYGMAGPGCFGFKVNVQNNFMWIIVCIWNADGYMMLDDRVFSAAKHYKEDYNPWYISSNQFDKHFIKELLNYKIINLSISDESMTVTLEKEGVSRQIDILKNDKKLPPMGSGAERIDAFSYGRMSDYIMVIYDGSNIFVD